MSPIVFLIDSFLSLYILGVFIYVIAQLLIHFNVINPYQPLISKIMGFLAGIIEPALAKIRKYIKPINGFDISPVILLLLLQFIQYTVIYYLA